jgi:hypothetical protein
MALSNGVSLRALDAETHVLRHPGTLARSDSLYIH